MGLDERLFGYLYELARRFRSPASAGDGPEAGNVVVHLAPLRPRLQMLASLLGKHEDPRDALHDLPESIRADSLEEGVHLYVYRLVLTWHFFRKGLYLPQPAKKMSAEDRTAATLSVLPQAWAELEQELPGAHALRMQLGSRALRSVELPEKIQRDPGWQGLLPKPDPDTKNDQETISTERKSKRRREVRRRIRHLEQGDENPLIHVFEKIRTAEEHKGGRQNADGSDELDEHLQALEEVDLEDLIVSRETTRSIYQADLPAGLAPPEMESAASPGTAYLYDEWDHRRRQYQKNHCQVHVQTGNDTNDRADQEVLLESINQVLRRNQHQRRELMLAFSRISQRFQVVERCNDGPEVDIDAMADRHGALRAGRALGDRLYLAKKPKRPQLATLILIDSSLSTDGWVKGRRVLDVAKESVLLLGEVLCGRSGVGAGSWGGQVGISAFHSHTRHDCRFLLLKDFVDPWETARLRVAELAPAGYTRIGPALRHGLSLLYKVPAQKRLLLLLSDGKPTDYDRYEGMYGMADVHKAVLEVQERHVVPFALALAGEAHAYLPRIFGKGNFEILSDPSELPLRMAKLWGRLTR